MHSFVDIEDSIAKTILLADVRKLLPEGLLTEQLATGIARVYNTRTGKVVTAPSGRKVKLR